MLTWTLTICTYNRPDFLQETVRHALAQSRPPAEVVIVDASDDWADHCARIQTRFVEEWDRVRLVFVPADVRSLTCQRNQALDLATGDIVFSLDDDIYLFPDAAEIILAGYEADRAEDVAMIAGHFTPGPPGAEPREDETTPRAAPGALGSMKTSVTDLVSGQMSLANHFVPYDTPVDMSPVPESVAHLNLYPAGLINGGRTTFRRCFGAQTGWSEMLRYYATHEDSDFSYRTGQFGRLLTAPDAGFFHADGNPGGASRFRVNTIRVRNLMALHAEHSPNKARSALRLAASFGKYCALYLVIDPLQQRFSLPTARAYAYGLLQIPVFLFWPFADFKAWYIRLQERMYGSRYTS